MLSISRFALIIAATSFLSACSDSDDGPDPELPIPSLDAPPNALASGVVSQDQLTSMQELGFVFNEGSDPPSIEGAFVHAPAVLQASNNPNDVDRIGDVFNSVIIEFSNQDMEQQSADLTFSEFFEGETADLSRSTDSFISGTGSLFSAYFTVVGAETTDNSPTGTIALSGEVTANGIINLQEAFLNFDAGAGNTGNTITGRVFIDQDGFSEIFVEQEQALELPTLIELPIDIIRSRGVADTRATHGSQH